MRADIRKEYGRQRAHWNAETSLRHARIVTAFKRREDVRLTWIPDQETYDDSYIDTWTDRRECDRERDRKALWESIERDGVWGLVSERRCPCCGQWETVDGVWGFVGQDAHGYEFDLMASALDTKGAQHA